MSFTPICSWPYWVMCVGSDHRAILLLDLFVLFHSLSVHPVALIVRLLSRRRGTWPTPSTFALLDALSYVLHSNLQLNPSDSLFSFYVLWPFSSRHSKSKSRTFLLLLVKAKDPSHRLTTPLLIILDHWGPIYQFSLSYHLDFGRFLAFFHPAPWYPCCRSNSSHVVFEMRDIHSHYVYPFWWSRSCPSPQTSFTWHLRRC